MLRFASMTSATGRIPPKILCLTPHNLDAPEYGAVLRARNVFRLLSQIGKVRVVLAGACGAETVNAKSLFGGFELVDEIRFQPSPRRSIASHLRYEFDGRFLDTEKVQASAKDRNRLQSLMAAYDLVWIHSLRVANGFGIFRWPRSVLDIDDVPSSFHRTNLAHSVKIGDRFRNYRRMTRWRRREKNLLDRFDAVCVCSEPDRRELGGSDRIFMVPNGFDAPKKIPLRQPATPPRIGFVGTFRYSPNCDGIRWFLKCVWPLILRTMPQTRLRVAGDGSEDVVGKTHPNVEALGWIADVESEMATWSLAVVPVFVGGGTRIKIAEAFGRKCPVVSTTLGAYGYDVADGRELLLADSAGDFAVGCLRILTNPADGQAMAENAWRKFLENWTWNSSANRIAGVVESILRRTAQPACRKL